MNPTIAPVEDIAQPFSQTTIISRTNQLFPWLEHLPPEEIDKFYKDFFKAIEQALHTKNWSILEQTIESWQATAELLTDAELTMILTEPTTDKDLEDWDDIEAELFNKDS
jgi:hypothetical protein